MNILLYLLLATDPALQAAGGEAPGGVPAPDAAAGPHLFDFADPAVAAGWRSIDDRVMGGVSTSRLAAGEGAAIFEGTLSLEHGGGFCSVRSRAAERDLSGLDGVTLRVRGDGRTWQLALRTDASFDGVAWHATFAPPAGRWTTVTLPWDAFAPRWHGRDVPGAGPLDPSRVLTFGLLVAGRQAGAFRLEIAAIDGWNEAEAEG
jgi:monofunctional biosynthetic peptidoglycan transglycosylase